MFYLMSVLYYLQLQKYYPHEHFYQSAATRQIPTFLYTEKSFGIRKTGVFFKAAFLIFIFLKTCEFCHPNKSSYLSQT